MLEYHYYRRMTRGHCAPPPPIKRGGESDAMIRVRFVWNSGKIRAKIRAKIFIFVFSLFLFPLPSVKLQDAMHHYPYTGIKIWTISDARTIQQKSKPTPPPPPPKKKVLKV